MKNKAIIVIILVIILPVLLFLIFNYIDNKQRLDFFMMPFNNLYIFNKEVILNEGQKTYYTTADCSDFNNSNVQIISYKLKESYKDYNIKVSSNIYSNSILLEDVYENVTNIHVIISMKSLKEYEQIFYVDVVCQNS